MPYKDKEQQKAANKQAAQRRRDSAKGVTQGMTGEGVTQGMTDLEQCRYCSAPLPALAKPRRHPGACYPCAMKQPRKPSIIALVDTVYAGAEVPKPPKGAGLSI